MGKLTNKLRWAWFDFGVREERNRIILLAENKVCFDNRDNGECEHSACYEMINLIERINEHDDLIELETLEIPQFEGTREEIKALTIKGENK